MAESDWTVVSGSLGAGDVLKGVTAGIVPPNGGGLFTYGLNSITAIPGTVALFTNQLNFDPITGGGRVSGALQRVKGAAGVGWSSFLFIALQSDDVDAVCYMLGLSDASPSKIILRKGIMSEGFPAETVDPTVNGVLNVGSNNFPEDTWVHLRLDMALNTNGDAVLSVFRNDLGANQVGSPDFKPVPGMDDISPGSGVAFIDDVLGVNTGTIPLVAGRAGFGFEVDGVSRRSFFDHVTVARQI